METDYIDKNYVWQRRVHTVFNRGQSSVLFPFASAVGVEYNPAFERRDSISLDVVTNGSILDIHRFIKQVTKTASLHLLDILNFNFKLGADVDPPRCPSYAAKVYASAKALKEQFKTRPQQLHSLLGEGFPLPDLTLENPDLSQKPEDPWVHDERKGEAFLTHKAAKQKVQLSMDCFPLSQKSGIAFVLQPSNAPPQKLSTTCLTYGIMLEMLDFAQILSGSYPQMLKEVILHNFGPVFEPSYLGGQVKALLKKVSISTWERQQAFCQEPFKFMNRRVVRTDRTNKRPSGLDPDVGIVPEKRWRENIEEDKSEASYLCPIESEESDTCPVESEVSYTCPVESEVSDTCPVESEVSDTCPVESEVSYTCPVESEVSYTCPVESEVPYTCPVESEVPYTCPVESEVSYTCPVESEVSYMCPVESEVSYMCPVEFEESDTCPVEPEASYMCPLESEESDTCPVESEVSYMCPVESEESDTCPVESEVSYMCPLESEESNVCPVESEVSYMCPLESEEYNVCPVESEESNMCPVESEVSYTCPVESEESHTCPVESEVSHTCPVESEVSHTCPVESEVSYTCPVESEVSYTCPVESEVSYTCPVESEVSYTCPVESEVSYTCPVESEVSYTCPVESEVSCTCPVEPEVSYTCPVESEVSYTCPVESEVSYTCPVESEVSYTCPVESEVSYTCPVEPEASYMCPVESEPDLQPSPEADEGLEVVVPGASPEKQLEVPVPSKNASKPRYFGFRSTGKRKNTPVVPTSEIFSEDVVPMNQKTVKQKEWARRSDRIKQIFNKMSHNLIRCREIRLDFNVGSGRRQNLDLNLLTNHTLFEANRFSVFLSKSVSVFLRDVMKGNFHLCFQDEMHERSFLSYLLCKEKTLWNQMHNQAFLRARIVFPEGYSVAGKRQWNGAQANVPDDVPDGDLSEDFPFCKDLQINLWSLQGKPPEGKLELSLLTNGALIEIITFSRRMASNPRDLLNDVLEHNFDVDLQDPTTEDSKGLDRWLQVNKYLVRKPFSALKSPWLLEKVSLKQFCSHQEQLFMETNAPAAPPDECSYGICEAIGLELNVSRRSPSKQKLDLRLLTRGALFEVHHFVKTNCNRYVPALFEILDYNLDLSSQRHRRVELAWSVAAQVLAMVRKGPRGGRYMSQAFELPLETPGQDIKEEPEEPDPGPESEPGDDLVFVHRLIPVDIAVQIE